MNCKSGKKHCGFAKYLSTRDIICLAKKRIINNYNIDNQLLISFEKSLRKRLTNNQIKTIIKINIIL